MVSEKKILKRTFAVLGISREWALVCQQEFSMIGIRIYAACSTQRSRIRTLVAQAPVHLVFGCGATRYPHWTGIDCYFGSAADVLLDLRRPLPFPDESTDFCFSEHFLEHLYPDEGIAHLREVARILKPGGVYRIVVPDVVKFFQKYLEQDQEFFKLAFPWAQRPMQALYDVANWGGRHRNILDLAELEFMAKQSGFSHAVTSEAGASSYPILKIDRMEPQRIAESLYVELVKR
jgi:predicted SAM-dependent methyltransferase